MAFLTRTWRTAVEWFEHGDLVPLLVVVSAAHYANILAGKDPLIVAIAIGILVDISHYRTVRAAVRYQNRNWQMIARWSVALAMTAVALTYHLRYYDNDIWLAAPLPFLIATLAWLSKVDAGVGARQKQAPVAPAKVEQPAAETFTATCERCNWSHNHYKSQRAASNALNAHRRGCKEIVPC